MWGAGCAPASRPARLVELPRWELTVAQTVHLTPVVRTRVSPNRPLPAHLVQQLCAEYSLITIRRPSDWAEVHRRLQLPAELARLNLESGPVVGILAEVGEQADGLWPLRLVDVRVTNRAGLLEAVFLPGLYHPVATAGYLELAQVPGLVTVTTVRINSRVFTIHSAGGLD